MSFKLAGFFSGFSSRADGSAGLRFVSNELSGSDFAALKDSHNQFGWVVFKENELQDEDIPTETAPQEGKTPSQRLRDRMYVYWVKKGISSDFDAWRRQQLEIIGQRYLDQVDGD